MCVISVCCHDHLCYEEPAKYTFNKITKYMSRYVVVTNIKSLLPCSFF